MDRRRRALIHRREAAARALKAAQRKQAREAGAMDRRLEAMACREEAAARALEAAQKRIGAEQRDLGRRQWAEEGRTPGEDACWAARYPRRAGELWSPTACPQAGAPCAPRGPRGDLEDPGGCLEIEMKREREAGEGSPFPARGGHSHMTRVGIDPVCGLLRGGPTHLTAPCWIIPKSAGSRQ